MLILKRKVGEVITINEEIHVRVISIRNNAVELGIDAPDYCKIIRKEIDDLE